jgi:DNA-directed RNA polymerase specialized sigma24 family protein
LGAHKVLNIERARDHEKIFLDHYKWLLECACKLTSGSREEAEDLVQDLYVRFVQSEASPDASDEDRLRGYLYKTLKNLSISKGLRNGRDALSNLLVVDYDSVEFALSAVDRSRLLHVRSDLARICDYALIRRRTGRAASILILRFFFGYYPSEIVSILQTTRVAVDRLLQIARQEAKVFLTRPGALHFISEAASAKTPSFSQYLPDDPAVLFAELRRRIFSEVEGKCPEAGEIEDRYNSPPASPWTTTGLAHLVSCSNCLERVNTLLHLPGLAERFPSDFIDRDNGDPPPPSCTDRSDAPKLRRKLRETFEHRPSKLQIAVNGEIRGGQEVTSARSNFQIKLKPFSRPEFVEVLSEQGLSLFYLDLDNKETTDPSPQRGEVQLSDERSLVVEITLIGGNHVVNVAYYDPLLEDVSESWTGDPKLSPLVDVPNASHSVPAKARFAAPLRDTLSSWRSDLDWRWPLSFGIATCLIAALVGLPVLKNRLEKTTVLPTATALLTESKHAYEIAVPPHGAEHRTFAFEVRSDKGSLVDSGKVETFRSRIPNRSASRLLSSNGKLIAGRWIDGAGKLITYSTKQGLQRPQNTQQPQSTFDVSWANVPDAQGFEQIGRDTGELTVHRNQDSYELDYLDSAVSDSPTVVFAHLVLAAASMRPVAETLRIRDGRETREYQFRELTYEVIPANRVQESDFTPEPELLSRRSSPAGDPAIGLHDAHLALEAIQLLSNLGPEVERIVDIERLSDGSVQLSGVFPSSEQKAAVQRVFEPLAGGGQLKLALHSNDEPAESTKTHELSKVESLSAVEVENDHIPFDSELRSALSSEGLSGQTLDGKIREVASDITTHGAQLHREAWSIRQIAANDFTNSELRLMQPEDKILWLTLLDKQIRSFDQELTALDGDLKFLLSNEKARLQAPGSTIPSPNNTNELATLARAMNSDSERLDRLLTAGFTLSPSSLPTNHNVADIAELLADLRIQESMLHVTVEHLQAPGLAGRSE